MTEYRVRWEIDLTGDSPEEVARKALETQRNPDSIAKVFDVFAQDGTITRVDLEEDEVDDFDYTSVDYPGYDPQMDHFERFGRPALPNEY